MKKYIYLWVIIKEWIDGGEFKNIKKAVVVGNLKYARLIKYIFRNEVIRVYFCDRKVFKMKYRQYDDIKWILCDDLAEANEDNLHFNCISLPF